MANPLFWLQFRWTLGHHKRLLYNPISDSGGWTPDTHEKETRKFRQTVWQRQNPKIQRRTRPYFREANLTPLLYISFDFNYVQQNLPGCQPQSTHQRSRVAPTTTLTSPTMSTWIPNASKDKRSHILSCNSFREILQVKVEPPLSHQSSIMAYLHYGALQLCKHQYQDRLQWWCLVATSRSIQNRHGQLTAESLSECIRRCHNSSRGCLPSTCRYQHHTHQRPCSTNGKWLVTMTSLLVWIFEGF